MFKTLDRYILAEFFKILLLSLATLIAFYEMVVFMDYFGHFQKYGASADMVIRYMLFKIPMAVFHVTPICVLLASLLTASSLSRYSELTAMKSAGLSMIRIFLPVVVASGGISLLAYIDSEHLFHLAARETSRIYNEEIKKQPRKTLFARDKFWYKGEDGSIWNIGHIDIKHGVLQDISIFRFNERGGKGITTRIISPEAHLRGRAWFFSDYVERRFSGGGAFVEQRYDEKKISDTIIKGENFAKVKLNAEEMNRAQLGEYIDDISAKGYDATRYIVERMAKTAFPLICLVMPLIAIPMGVRSSRSGGAMIGVAVALSLGAGFWFIFSMGLAFGKAGRLPPELGAYGAHILFGSIGLFMLLSKRQ